MPQAKPYKEYYTAAQAKEKLGVTDGMLYNYVRYGHLERIVPPGRKQGVYKRDEVDRLARDLQSFVSRGKTKPTQFEKLRTKEEMAKCQEISMAAFGVKRDIADLMKTVEKNPETYYVLKDEGEIVGYTAMWPVKTEKLNELLAQTLPVQILQEDIETFERGKGVDIYITVIVVRPGFAREEKRHYGARLISGLTGVIEKLGKRGIPIGTIAARSNMPEGIRLMRNMGFTEIKPLTPERRTFVINVKESGIPFIQQYQKALEEGGATAKT